MKRTVLILAAVALAIGLPSCASSKAVDPFDAAVSAAMVGLFAAPVTDRKGGAQ